MNQLAKEGSLYLRQHAKNPVDWYPWGEEALSKAKAENRPIFLSVGYSSCHWCHVMAHECFEDTEIAQVLNKHFVSIKVDREERPDLDLIYQNVAQVFTRGGGWPLSVFLLPDLKPFFGGTYFPPRDRYGRPGFKKVLLGLIEAFQKDQDAVRNQAQKITDVIQGMETFSEEIDHSTDFIPHLKTLESLAEKALSQIDPVNGGLLGAPKFSQPQLLGFLWRLSYSTSFPALREKLQAAVKLTLNQMARGGIYDQLGDGFHRYSVDEKWDVPHFEKMLYDNALMLRLYSEIVLTSESETFLEEDTVIGILQYLTREMKTKEGFYCSSQDADSEGVEGKFFTWGDQEIFSVLSKEEAEYFFEVFGEVTHSEEGEVPKRVLTFRTADSSEKRSAKFLGLKNKAFLIRENRPKPETDHKVLLYWNALTLSGLSWASLAFQGKNEEATRLADQAALELYGAIQKNFIHRDKDLVHSVFSQGEAFGFATLDDVSGLALSLLDLLRKPREKKMEEEILDLTDWLTEYALKHFANPALEFPFSFSDARADTPLFRPQTLNDSPTPAGLSMLMKLLLIRSERDESGFSKFNAAKEKMRALYSLFLKNPLAMGEMACNALLESQGPVWFVDQEIEFPHAHFFWKSGKEKSYCHQGVCHPGKPELQSLIRSDQKNAESPSP